MLQRAVTVWTIGFRVRVKVRMRVEMLYRPPTSVIVTSRLRLRIDMPHSPILTHKSKKTFGTIYALQAHQQQPSPQALLMIAPKNSPVAIQNVHDMSTTYHLYLLGLLNGRECYCTPYYKTPMMQPKDVA